MSVGAPVSIRGLSVRPSELAGRTPPATRMSLVTLVPPSGGQQSHRVRLEPKVSSLPKGLNSRVDSKSTGRGQCRRRDGHQNRDREACLAR